MNLLRPCAARDITSSDLAELPAIQDAILLRRDKAARKGGRTELGCGRTGRRRLRSDTDSPAGQCRSSHHQPPPIGDIGLTSSRITGICTRRSRSIPAVFHHTISTVAEAGLSACDRDKKLAYLDSTNPRNIPTLRTVWAPSAGQDPGGSASCRVSDAAPAALPANGH